MIRDYKKLLKKLGITGKEMSEKLNLSYGSYKTMTKKGSSVPRWALSFMIGYELGKNS